MSGLKRKLKNMSVLLMICALCWTPKLSLAQFSLDIKTIQPKMSDKLFEKCNQCQHSLSECVDDLKGCRDMRPSKEWWNNDLFVWGLSITSFGLGFIVGVYSK